VVVSSNIDNPTGPLVTDVKLENKISEAPYLNKTFNFSRLYYHIYVCSGSCLIWGASVSHVFFTAGTKLETTVVGLASSGITFI
jgi:hypothetical protein